MNVGLFFGSFNPIHIGHLIIANHMVEHSNLDKIWFVVTPHNPHKNKSTLLNDNQRLAMVSLAVEDYPKLSASNIEFELPQPSYTVNTLARICEKYPEHTFSPIIGEDNLRSFHKWKNADVIIENHEVYVYPRVLGSAVNHKFTDHNKFHKIDAPIIEISSSLIRKYIKEGKNYKPLVPENVWQYIDEMNFYKE